MLLHNQLEDYNLILASASPRRRELLAGLDVDFTVRALPDVDESFPATLQGGDIPLYISGSFRAAPYASSGKSHPDH